MAAEFYLLSPYHISGMGLVQKNQRIENSSAFFGGHMNKVSEDFHRLWMVWAII